MSNGKNDQGKPGSVPPVGPGSNQGSNQGLNQPPKRPTPTIDLEAKEIEIRDLSKSPETLSAAAPKATESVKTDAKPAESKADPAKPQDRDAKAAAPKAGTSVPPSASASVPPPVARQGGSTIGRLLSHLAAGAVGAFLALIGADQLANQVGIKLPSPGSTQMADLGTRVSTLDQKLAELQSDAASSEVRERLKQVQAQLDQSNAKAKQSADELAALKTAQAVASAQLAGADKKIADALGQAPAERLNKLEQTFASLAAAGNDGDKGKLPQLAGMIARLDALEASLDGRLEVVQRSVADGLQKQQVRLEERLAAVDKPVELETVKASTRQLSDEVVSVKANAEKLAQDIQQTRVSGTQVREELAALKEQANAIDAAIKGEFDKVVKTEQFGSVTATLGKLEADVGGIVAKEQEREASANRILLALELANLKRAIERGGAYERELAQVKAVAPKEFDLSALATDAKTGLATQALLLREFRDAARAAVAAEAAPPEDGSFIDRLVAGARSVVHVRKTGNVEGQTAEAVVARMEKLLSDGDLEQALKEAEGLTGAAREAARGWLDKLSARLAVDRAMHAVDDGLRRLMTSPQAG